MSDDASDPTNQVETAPAITDIEMLETSPDGRHLSAFTYDIPGVDLTGTSEQVDRVPGDRLVCDRSGALDARTTRVHYAAEYDLPSRVLEHVVRPLAERYNERTLSTTLSNLKTRAEATADATA